MLDREVEDDEIILLYHLHSDPGLTTSELAKEIFDIGDTDDLRNKDNRVRYFLEDKYNHLVDSEKENGKKRYFLDEELIYFGFAKLEMASFDGDKVSLGMGECMIYMDEEDRPTLVDLETKEESS